MRVRELTSKRPRRKMDIKMASFCNRAGSAISLFNAETAAQYSNLGRSPYWLRFADEWARAAAWRACMKGDTEVLTAMKGRATNTPTLASKHKS
jgi:hypothetical protein